MSNGLNVILNPQFSDTANGLMAYPSSGLSEYFAIPTQSGVGGGPVSE